jgi:hypothetical protein
MNPRFIPSMKIVRRLGLALFLSATAFPLVAQTNVFPSTGNVGVGTAAPAALFHLSGSSATKLLLDNGVILSQKNAAGAIHNLLTHYTDDNVYLDNLDGHIVFRASNAAGNLVFQTSASEKMRIDTVGNVGVGTASPGASVDIWKPYSAGTDSLRFSYNDGAAYWMGIQPYVVTAGNVGYKFRTNNGSITSEALAITGAGSVGIGTASPLAKLDVSGSGTASLFRTVHIGSGGSLLFEGTGATSSRFSIDVNIFRVTGFGNTSLYADTYTGNVGIGTTSPTHKLAVNGTIRAKEVIVDTGWSDYVFKPDYKLASLSEVEGAIQRDGHLPGIPSAQEIAEHGVRMGEMQAKLLAKIEELTLHQIAQEKRHAELELQVQLLQKENRSLHPEFTQ